MAITIKKINSEKFLITQNDLEQIRVVAIECWKKSIQDVKDTCIQELENSALFVGNEALKKG